MNISIDVDVKVEACGICGSDVHTIGGKKFDSSCEIYLICYRRLGTQELALVLWPRYVSLFVIVLMQQLSHW